MMEKNNATVTSNMEILNTSAESIDESEKTSNELNERQLKLKKRLESDFNPQYLQFDSSLSKTRSRYGRAQTSLNVSNENNNSRMSETSNVTEKEDNESLNYRCLKSSEIMDKLFHENRKNALLSRSKIISEYRELISNNNGHSSCLFENSGFYNYEKNLNKTTSDLISHNTNDIENREITIQKKNRRKSYSAPTKISFDKLHEPLLQYSKIDGLTITNNLTPYNIYKEEILSNQLGRNNSNPLIPSLIVNEPFYSVVDDEWSEGDICWGRIGSYPFWPCLICDDPSTGSFLKITDPKSSRNSLRIKYYHVRFFADNGRRSEIKSHCLIPFTSLEDFKKRADEITPEQRRKNPKHCNAFNVPTSRYVSWKNAIEEALVVMKRPKIYRLDYFNSPNYFNSPKLNYFKGVKSISSKAPTCAENNKVKNNDAFDKLIEHFSESANHKPKRGKALKHKYFEKRKSSEVPRKKRKIMLEINDSNSQSSLLNYSLKSNKADDEMNASLVGNNDHSSILKPGKNYDSEETNLNTYPIENILEFEKTVCQHMGFEASMSKNELQVISTDVDKSVIRSEPTTPIKELNLKNIFDLIRPLNNVSDQSESDTTTHKELGQKIISVDPQKLSVKQAEVVCSQNENNLEESAIVHDISTNKILVKNYQAKTSTPIVHRKSKRSLKFDDSNIITLKEPTSNIENLLLGQNILSEESWRKELKVDAECNQLNIDNTTFNESKDGKKKSVTHNSKCTSEDKMPKDSDTVIIWRKSKRSLKFNESNIVPSEEPTNYKENLFSEHNLSEESCRKEIKVDVESNQLISDNTKFKESEEEKKKSVTHNSKCSSEDKMLKDSDTVIVSRKSKRSLKFDESNIVASEEPKSHEENLLVELNNLSEESWRKEMKVDIESKQLNSDNTKFNESEDEKKISIIHKSKCTSEDNKMLKDSNSVIVRRKSKRSLKFNEPNIVASEEPTSHKDNLLAEQNNLPEEPWRKEMKVDIESDETNSSNIKLKEIKDEKKLSLTHSKCTFEDNKMIRESDTIIVRRKSKRSLKLIKSSLEGPEEPTNHRENAHVDQNMFEEFHKKELKMSAENNKTNTYDYKYKAEERLPIVHNSKNPSGNINLPKDSQIAKMKPLRRRSSRRSSTKDTDGNMRNRSSENLSDSTSESEMKKKLPKKHKAGLFKGLCRENVCIVCEKPGELIKCRGFCGNYFHYICAFPNESVFEQKTIVDKDVFEMHASTHMNEIMSLKPKPNSSESSSDETNDDEEVGCKIIQVGKPEIVSNYDSDRINLFKCSSCLSNRKPKCFVCCNENYENEKKSDRRKCCINQCGNFFHTECLKMFPQTKINFGSAISKKSVKAQDTFECAHHVCHTCVSDNPHGNKSRFSNEKLSKCIRCPTAYHTDIHCIPAGTILLTSSQIICTKHFDINKKSKNGIIQHLNVFWCFICAVGGSLICCEMCPTAFHVECLGIPQPEGKYICEDCEAGRFPLYNEVVWCKMATFRWWPAIILPPYEIPPRLYDVPHEPGNFCVRFFGSLDHHWTTRGKVFLFYEGDAAYTKSIKKNIDGMFATAVQDANVVYKRFKRARELHTAKITEDLRPPYYIKIKTNKFAGSVKAIEQDVSFTTPCECDPNSTDPCGPNSLCLNRILLYECNPLVCPAGVKCCNQDFEKKEYPPLIPFVTKGKGWGLKTLSSLTTGQFIIEYVGDVIDNIEFNRRLEAKSKARDENFYFLVLDKDRIIDAGPKGNVSRFMNHSCDPNCETQKWTVNGDTRVGLFAIKDIEADTELTFNYNLESTGGDMKKKCHCGAAQCVGFIGAKKSSKIKKKKL